MSDTLRGATAIVGVGEAGIGEAGPGWTALDLIGQATSAALRDSGVGKHEIDGLFSASPYYFFTTASIGEYLGIRPRYSDTTNLGGSSFVAHLHHAAAAIRAGQCSVALIVYGSTQRTDGGRLVSGAEPSLFETPYRPRYPISMYALAAARHMYQYGTTREQVAAVAVAARQWANLNPAAFARGPLTIDDVLGSRMLCDPLTIRDCCLVTDGAGAVIVTAADRARSLRRPPVFVLGAGEAHWHRHISSMPDLTITAARDSGRRAFEMARLTPQDVDVAQLYDAFTINTILFLEDLGFCAKGEGGPFVASGAIAPGGALPVNTNGGGLSYCHPGMYGIFTIIEATRQIRGEAGDRQQPGVEVALAHGNGGVLTAQATAILGAQSTL